MIGKNFIAGQFSAEGTATVQSYNASTGEPLPHHFVEATTAEVAAACEKAHAAFRVYRATTLEQRALFLEAVADEIAALDDSFLAIVHQETALPLARLQGEKGRTCGQLRLFATLLRRGDFLGARVDTKQPDRQPLPRADLRQIKMGIGPVGVFGASNFPLAFSVAGGDTASALAAGCPVVVKAHPAHMLTSYYVAEAINRAVAKTAMPAGVFSMVYGAQAGKDIVLNEHIQAIGFTGSLQGGRALYDLASARPKPIPVFSEMSSINPVLMLPAALQQRSDSIATQLANSVTMGAGQFCTNPGLVVGITSPEFSHFVRLLAEKMQAQNGQVMLHKGILQSYEKSIATLKNTAGFTHVSGKEQLGDLALPQLFKADSALLVAKSELLQEEIFGPVTIVVEVSTKAELLQALAGMNGQLTATLIAEEADLDEFADLVPVLEEKVGRLIVNDYPTGVEVCDAMVHGGPYPATTDARGTSVGTLAIDRFLRPVCYQGYPQRLLPEALQDENPLGIWRLVDGTLTKAAI